MSNQQLEPGSLFAERFEIEGLAGSGGMGTVYRAFDRGSQCVVALKLLRAATAQSSEGERFAREAQILSELRHPGIVSYVTEGETALGQRFLAMEWLDGRDLSERLARGPLSLHESLLVLGQVADALAVAHQRGIIHRDLKPTNLFLVDGDVARVKLLDFGIARRIGTSRAITRTGVLIGTPEYMAPEQARGSRELSPAADMFSLGCVLYECLTGQPPFIAEHIATVLTRILFEEPASIEEQLPTVPPAVSKLLGLLLVKDPAQRLADAAALREQLARVGGLVGPVEAAVIGPWPRARRFADREQGLFSVVLATSDDADGEHLATHPGSGIQLPSTDRRALLQALAALRVSSDLLANGTLVVTVPALDSAQDQAILAARAALLIKERWPEAAVAMATGRGTARGRTAVGEVVERAARALERCSPETSEKRPSGVWADPLSAKLLDGRFAQLPQPDGALLLHEERDVDVDRPLLGKPTPCVGRDAELGTLEAQLAACIDESEAHLVLFTAPPGAGKSRLRHEFLRRVEKRSEPLTLLLGRGDVMSIGAPYGILRSAIHKLCGITGSEPLELQRERLRVRVAQNLAPEVAEQIVPFIGELCSVPFVAEGWPMLQAARQDPKILRDRVRRAFLDFLSAECAERPVLLVLDDLQWADGLTVSLLDEAMHEQRKAPLFILAFARPEAYSVFPRLWSSHGGLRMPLRGLSKKACARLIEQVLGPAVPSADLARAVEQSAGNALFLEELIRSLAEGKPELRSETVVAMLQARLGRLAGDLRLVVRAAAVFGQTFWLGGVAALLGLPASETALGTWLSALVELELVLPQPESRLKDQPEYRFRHALVRDAAYGLLTDQDLQAGHLRAAEFLATAGERDVSALGEHFEKGGDLIRAAHAFSKAAELALGQGDLESALRYVARSLRCEPSGELLGVLRSIESSALFWMFEYERAFSSTMEALTLLPPGSGAYCRALSIGCEVAIHGSERAQKKLPELFPLLLTVEPDAQGRVHLIEGLSDIVSTMCVTSPYSELRAVLSRLETLVGQALDQNPLLERWLLYCRCQIVHHHEPTPWKALQESLRGLALAEQAGDQLTRFKIEVMGWAMVMAELAAAELPDRLRAIIRDARSGEEKFVPVITRILLGLILGSQSEPAAQEEALRCARDVMSIGAEMMMAAGFGRLLLALVALQRNQPVEAEAEVRAALPLMEYLILWMPLAQRLLMLSLLAQSRTAEAVAAAESGLALLARLGCVGCIEVELRLAISEVFYGAGDVPRAQQELRATLWQIQLRADDILDPDWRKSYLTRNPHCARALALAQQWGGSAPIP